MCFYRRRWRPRTQRRRRRRRSIGRSCSAWKGSCRSAAFPTRAVSFVAAPINLPFALGPLPPLLLGGAQAGQSHPRRRDRRRRPRRHRRRRGCATGRGHPCRPGLFCSLTLINLQGATTRLTTSVSPHFSLSRDHRASSFPWCGGGRRSVRWWRRTDVWRTCCGKETTSAPCCRRGALRGTMRDAGGRYGGGIDPSCPPAHPLAHLFYSFLVYLTIDQSTTSPPLVRSESARGALEAEHEALRASCAALARELDAQQVPEPF